MANYHVVSQGEHISAIAHGYGFRSYTEIWNHPNNASLKSQRKNPNVLYPGDQVFIPDLEKGEYSRSTDAKHKFSVKVDRLELRLTLEDQYEKKIAGAKCLLIIEGETKQLTTDGAGAIKVPIPPTAHEVHLVIQDAAQTPYAGVDIPIKIGDLDPVEELSGQQGRLRNLGYFWGGIDGQDSADFESSVQEFQCDHSLKVDGECGPATQAKLKEVHGC